MCGIVIVDVLENIGDLGVFGFDLSSWDACASKKFKQHIDGV